MPRKNLQKKPEAKSCAQQTQVETSSPDLKKVENLPPKKQASGVVPSHLVSAMQKLSIDIKNKYTRQRAQARYGRRKYDPAVYHEMSSARLIRETSPSRMLRYDNTRVLRRGKIVYSQSTASIRSNGCDTLISTLEEEIEKNGFASLDITGANNLYSFMSMIGGRGAFA